jgi:hypothetical protein
MDSSSFNVVVVLSALALACSHVPSPAPDDGTTNQSVKQASQQSVDAGDSGSALQGVTPQTSDASAASTAPQILGPGFTFQIAASKFSPGSSWIQKSEVGMLKLVGDQGVFATNPTGMVLAISNAAAAVRKRGGPLPGGAAAHDQAVRDYFVSAGLPQDQIDAVEAYPVLGAEIPPASLPVARSPAGTPLFNYSMIRRQIAGIPVPDSYAWARINQDAAVVCESVYWPQIPQSEIAKAQSLAQSMSNADSAAIYLAKLPSKRQGKVVIRHTPGEWNQGFVALAAYDVEDGSSNSRRIIHFDSDGVRRDLPHELPGAWGPAPSGHR